MDGPAVWRASSSPCRLRPCRWGCCRSPAGRPPSWRCALRPLPTTRPGPGRTPPHPHACTANFTLVLPMDRRRDGGAPLSTTSARSLWSAGVSPAKATASSRRLLSLILRLNCPHVLPAHPAPGRRVDLPVQGGLLPSPGDACPPDRGGWGALESADA